MPYLFDTPQQQFLIIFLYFIFNMMLSMWYGINKNSSKTVASFNTEKFCYPVFENAEIWLIAQSVS